MKRKAQIGETLTWIVATVIIIVILVISIFVSSFFKKRIYHDFSFRGSSDLIVSKSLTAYLLTSSSGGRIFEELGNENIYAFNENLAKKIFDGFYQEDYGLQRWIGVVQNNGNLLKKGIIGGRRPISGAQEGTRKVNPAISERIFLTKENILELIFTAK